MQKQGTVHLGAGYDADVEVQSLGTLPPNARSPSLARRLVRSVLEPVADDEVVAAVVLAVSELVTNAVEHAGTSIEIKAGIGGGRLRVEVADGSGELPRARPPDVERVGGRGLLLVSQLADRWSVDTTPVGKTVWFERRLDGHVNPDAAGRHQP